MSSAAELPGVDVLVIGAGPVGLAAGLSLRAAGWRVMLVDDHAEGQNSSRAAVVYPGTLEVLAPFGVSEGLASKGIRTPRFTIRDRDRILVAVPFDKLPTHFPYALLVSQAATEAAMLERYKELGGEIVRPLRAEQIRQEDKSVRVSFENGREAQASFVVGADGVHSTARKEAHIAMSARSRSASYCLADVRLAGGVPDDELVVYFSEAGHMVVLPLPGGIHRVVAHVTPAPEHPDVPFIQALLDERGPRNERSVVDEILWGSRFLTGHALANTYSRGRIALAGDAAHVHSPLGGQGMNLGIHDGVSLGAALGEMLRGGSAEVLDRYDVTQRSVAEHVINVTNLLTKAATLGSPLKEVRNLILSLVGPLAGPSLARRLSQLGYS